MEFLALVYTNPRDRRPRLPSLPFRARRPPETQRTALRGPRSVPPSDRTQGGRARSASFSSAVWAKLRSKSHNDPVRVSAKVDYALRAAIELAVAAPAQVKGERLAAAQAIPHKFLENILIDLRHGGLVASQRGADGGYRLAREPGEITVADVIRAVEGPIASVRGERPDAITYTGSAVPLRDVWIDLRAAMRGVLEQTTLADLVERGGALASEAHAGRPVL